MNKLIRKYKLQKHIAIFFIVLMLTTLISPNTAYALTGGPSAPEFEGFKPLGDNNMVNLFTGDLQYSIPLLDVGGYPLTLDYSGGIKMNQQATWVGLGWDLNAGAITREMRGIPDEFNGTDLVKQEFNMKPNLTIGVNGGAGGELFGQDIINNIGLGISYNNYTGLGITRSLGLSLLSRTNSNNNTASLGIGLSFEREGISITPSVSYERNMQISKKHDSKMNGSIGIPWNSRQGLKTFQVSGSAMGKKDGTLYKYGLGASYNFAKTYHIPSIEMPMTQTSFHGVFKFGSDFFAADGTINVGGFFSLQKLKYKTEDVPAFGYNTIQNTTNRAIQDFNIENEKPFSHTLPNMGVPNFTFDQYMVMGHGIGGTFRPVRSDAGHVYDRNVASSSLGGTLGIDLSVGNLFHGGSSITLATTDSHTGNWNYNNSAIPSLKHKKEAVDDLIAPFFFQMSDEQGVDLDIDPLENTSIVQKTGQYEPVAIDIQKSGGMDVIAHSNFARKYSSLQTMNSPFFRSKRPSLNQMVSYRKNNELSVSNLGHHIGEFTINKTDGSRYIYGKSLKNNKQRDVSFNVSGRPFNCEDGYAIYNPGDNSINNNLGKDHYFNAQELPPFSYSWLLTEILSTDYIDLNNDGPSVNDYGTWVKFEYQNNISNYKWRIPYEMNRAGFNEMLKSTIKDDRASYSYGEKEVTYLSTIKTKTHIAVFHTSNRNDAYEVLGENGGKGGQTLQKLDSIHLYALPDFTANGNTATPIKSVRFDYDYSLCKGIPSQSSGGQGKLTLKKVWFTYGRSYKGSLSTYDFAYNAFNPDYSPISHNMWGDFMLKTGQCDGGTIGLTSFEYPFPSSIRANEDMYASAWTLKTISLPEGGIINIELDADDYAYVQDKPAMEMVKVIGLGDDVAAFQSSGQNLYSISGNHLVLKLQLPSPVSSRYEFQQKYLKDISTESKPMYFKFLIDLNNNDNYEYVEGFAKIDHYEANQNIAFIKLKPVSIGDGNLTTINPISKAAWNFGRSHLPRMMSGLVDPIGDEADLPGETEAEDILRSLLSPSVINGVFEAFVGANGVLYTKGYGKKVNLAKSWVRLYNGNGHRLGGGHRVKKISMSDNWQNMAGSGYTSYDYIQTYDYKLDENGISSGVASYIPIGSKENPLVQPVFFTEHHILAPDDLHYTLQPFGESFFPNPSVGYRKVTMKTEVPSYVARKTGKTVHEFYTTYDFPTKCDHTRLNSIPQKTGILGSLLNVNIKDRMTVSQGYSIETNDMNGKKKSERVYAEGQEEAISGMDYIYETEDHTITFNPLNTNIKISRLKNKVPIVRSDGIVTEQNIGMSYDMFTWFSESESTTEISGFEPNLATFLLGFIPGAVPTIWPTKKFQNTRFRGAVTTKVINKKGILRKVIAYDLGAQVTTENVAWDETGQVILTKTENEFGDPIYNFKYPAYWKYSGMDAASKNLMFRKSINSNNGQITNVDHLESGDELIKLTDGSKFWVVKSGSGGLFLIDINRTLAPTFSDIVFKVVRSGHRNQQADNIGNITTTFNPIDHNDDGNFNSLSFISPISGSTGVLQASAVEKSENWQTKCFEPEFELICTLTQFGNLAIDYLNGQIDPRYYTEIDSTCFLKLKAVRQDGTPISTGSFTAIESTIEATLPIIGNIYSITFEGLTNPGGLPLGPITVTSSANCPLMTCQMVQVPTYCTNVVNAVINPYRKGIRGNWRTKKAYTYLTDRVQTNYAANADQSINLREDGLFKIFTPYWSNASGNWVNSTAPEWQWTAEVTKWLPTSQEVENRDALGRYSTAQFGYNDAFAIATATNSKYTQMGFDGFEDYDFNGLANNCNPSHFKFDDFANDVVSTQSHSGRNSIQLTPNGKISMKRKFTDIPCQMTYNDVPYTLKSCDCAGRFGPDGAQTNNITYVLSYWKKVENLTNIPLFNLPNIKPKLTSSSGQVYTIIENEVSKVIEGWQKNDIVFEIPANSSGEFILTFENTGGTKGWIDDVRIHPFDSNMKSYVYDPLTLRLWAVLDERNFATFYQYDKEGNLIRVKKETERGVMTIQENFSSLKK